MIKDILYRSLRSIFLTPLSLLWEGIYYIRRFFYNFRFFSVHNYKVPIISVGNVTFGGTGKTPFTVWLAEYLTRKSQVPLVLTRGYKGKLEHSSGILQKKDLENSNPEKFGDEAVLLANKLSSGGVAVGKNRVKNLEHYFKNLSPDVILLDDGHQHLKLGRNLNIVLFDSLAPLSSYKVAPLGYLREGLTALRDADAIVLTRADQVGESKLEGLKNLVRGYISSDILIAEASFKSNGLFNSGFTQVFTNEQIRGKKVLAMAGIGSPQSFFNLLQSLGANIVERVAFADHHAYTSEDVEKLEKKAKELDAIIVTSEKDMVKVRRLSSGNEIYYLGIEMDFLNGKEELISLVSSTCNLNLRNRFNDNEDNEKAQF